MLSGPPGLKWVYDLGKANAMKFLCKYRVPNIEFSQLTSDIIVYILLHLLEPNSELKPLTCSILAWPWGMEDVILPSTLTGQKASALINESTYLC